MKITVSKHTTIDWQAVRKEVIESTNNAVDELLKAAEVAADELAPGQSQTVSRDIGKITLRRSKE